MGGPFVISRIGQIGLIRLITLLALPLPLRDSHGSKLFAVTALIHEAALKRADLVI